MLSMLVGSILLLPPPKRQKAKGKAPFFVPPLALFVLSLLFSQRKKTGREAEIAKTHKLKIGLELKSTHGLEFELGLGLGLGLGLTRQNVYIYALHSFSLYLLSNTKIGRAHV